MTPSLRSSPPSTPGPTNLYSAFALEVIDGGIGIDWCRGKSALPYDVLEGLKLPIDARCDAGGLRGLAIGAFEVCADRRSRFVGSMLPAPVFDDLLRAKCDQDANDDDADFAANSRQPWIGLGKWTCM